MRIALKQAIIFMQNIVYIKGHISEFVFYFTLHLHEQKCDNGREYTRIRYYFFVRGLHYFIIVSPEDSFLLGRGINGDGFRRFDACEIHPMSFPS